jgi:hypothetical protein
VKSFKEADAKHKAKKKAEELAERKKAEAAKRLRAEKRRRVQEARDEQRRREREENEAALEGDGINPAYNPQVDDLDAYFDDPQLDAQRQEVSELPNVHEAVVEIVSSILTQRRAHLKSIASSLPPNPAPQGIDHHGGDESFDAADLGVIGLHDQSINTQRPPSYVPNPNPRGMPHFVPPSFLGTAFNDDDDMGQPEASSDAGGDAEELSDAGGDAEELSEASGEPSTSEPRSFPGDEDRDPVVRRFLVRAPPPDTAAEFMASFPNVEILRRASRAAMVARASTQQPDMVGSVVDGDANSLQDK